MELNTKKYVGKRFSGGAYIDSQFNEFFIDFKKDIKNMMKDTDWGISKWIKGHYFVSGFAYNKRYKEYAYFSVSDVRFFQDEWYNDVLVRRVKDGEDFIGGMNTYSPLSSLTKALDNTLKGVV